MNLKQLTYLIIIVIASLSSCNFKYVDEDQFTGTWELKGRRAFEGMQIEIFKENDKLKGKIIKLSDSDLVQSYAKPGNIWVKGIKRTSNFSFFLTESKIGAELLSLYDVSTSTKFKAEFINKNKIGLAEGSADPQKSTIFYKRIKQ